MSQGSQGEFSTYRYDPCLSELKSVADTGFEKGGHAYVIFLFFKSGKGEERSATDHDFNNS